jgi:hypothetical protein
MSWETTIIEEACFCGKGKRVITCRSDDWGHSESRDELQCDDCSARYVLAQVRGRDDRPMHWITREQFEQMEVAQAAAAKKRADATARAREELGDAFVAVLMPLRSRKRIWERLRDARISSFVMWSFAAFNRSVRSQGLPSTLRLLIDDRNAADIRKWLSDLGVSYASAVRS